jgi:hypothetical protein
MTPDRPLTYATRPLRPEVVAVLQGLKPGQRIRVTQQVRVGMKVWTTTVVGTFRHVDSLATGLATERVPEDDIVVPIVHFTKDNQELSTIAVDENTRIEVVDDRHLPEVKPL